MQSAKVKIVIDGILIAKFNIKYLPDEKDFLLQIDDFKFPKLKDFMSDDFT